MAAATVLPLASGRISEHLRWLRASVPGERLFAPRVAVLVASQDGERVVVDEHGELPWADLEIETSLTATAKGLLTGLGVPDGEQLVLDALAALGGRAWWDDGEELGPLAPIWIVVRAGPVDDPRERGLASGPVSRVRLAREALARSSGTRAVAVPTSGAGPAGGDYIARVRGRIGKAGSSIRGRAWPSADPEGRLLLVRHAGLQQWHCPGGGMDAHEAPETTAARELREETGLGVRAGRLLGCFARHVRAFPNGDRIQGVTLFMEGHVTGGELRPDPTGEVDAMGWFGADELPPLHPPWDARVRLALTGEGATLD